MQVEISFGEWADRLSILMIKSEKIPNEEKRSVCSNLATALGAQVNVSQFIMFHELFTELTEVNSKLWDVEEELRTELPDEKFLNLAKLVPALNDKRHKLKVAIDEKMGKIPEFKSYQ